LIFLIKENEKKEREKEINCYMKKSDIIKDRYKYNNYIRKDEQVYRENNKKFLQIISTYYIIIMKWNLLMPK